MRARMQSRLIAQCLLVLCHFQQETLLVAKTDKPDEKSNPGVEYQLVI
jgi:hypothetical protein